MKKLLKYDIVEAKFSRKKIMQLIKNIGWNKYKFY